MIFAPILFSLLVTLALSMAIMTIAWLASLALRDASIADILWGPGLAMMGWMAACYSARIGLTGWISLGLATIWALRLGTYLLFRRLGSGREDHRYTSIRSRFGPSFSLLSLVAVFWLQALLLWIVSWPLQVAVLAQSGNTLAVAGWALILAGIIIETVADRQLSAFRAIVHNAGRVLDSGLWRWSRHPNYFGDFLIWWGFFLTGLAAGASWWTIASPVLMSALLLHFSGVGLMEETIPDRRPAYKDYIERTGAFVLWPPAKR